MCDECLEEIDCIWPCEIMCILDYPHEYAGHVCEICLEFFGCQGCKFLCPTPDTDSPTKGPTLAPTLYPGEPTKAPTMHPSGPPTFAPTETPTSGPSSLPTILPTPGPSAEPTLPPTEMPTPGPTIEPTIPPTEAPTANPTYGPTPGPSVVPTLYPTELPTVTETRSPTEAPSVVPSLGPTTVPSFAPSITPQFFVYYSEMDEHLYSYNPVTDESVYVYKGDFAGDLKVDSVNKFMFWSSPNLGLISKLDLTDSSKTELLTLQEADSDTGVMGLAADPSRGELYYVNQVSQSIDIIDYSGSNGSVVHYLSDYGLSPYGLEISPAELMAAGSDPGYLLFSAADDEKGYIIYADLYGTDLTTLYSSDSKAIYGIVLDAESDMMWWIEDKGVANGIYSGPVWTDDFSATYVTYLENAKWIAGVWDLEILYSADYGEGQVYEFDIDASSGNIVNTAAIAKPEHPRCIAFYYAASVDMTPGPMAHLAPKPETGLYDPKTSQTSLTGDVPGSDILRQHKETADANYDQYRTRTDANVDSSDLEIKMTDQVAEMREAEAATEADEVTNSPSSSRGLLVGGGLVMVVVGGAALMVRRQRGYSRINELSI